MKNNSPIKIILKFIGLVIILPIAIFFSVNIIAIIGLRVFNFADNYHKFEVVGEPSRWFPIVALRQKHEENEKIEIDIIFIEDKNRYLQDYPNASFMLPPDNVEVFNEQLKEKCRKDQFYPTSLNPFCDMQKYQILKTDGNYQYIKATYETSYDYVNNGWYKTDGKTIVPLGGCPRIAFLRIFVL